MRDLPVITGDGLILRKVLPSDAVHIREISFYNGVAAATANEAAEMIDRIDQDMARGESLHWGICLEGSNEIVGTCGFYRGFEAGEGEIGYVLMDRYRGRGLMTTAVRLIVEYGFQTLGLVAIVASTEPSNERSASLLKRVGFSEVDGDENLTDSSHFRLQKPR